MSKTDINEVEINSVIYVRKGSEKITNDVSDDYCVIRTESAGVFAGEKVSKRDTVAGVEVVLENARRLWYWDGAASLSQLAMEGVKKPENCKFPREVTRITLPQVIEITPCTAEAIKSIKGVPVWEGDGEGFGSGLGFFGSGSGDGSGDGDGSGNG